MKYVAFVSKVVVRGIHKLATFEEGQVRPTAIYLRLSELRLSSMVLKKMSHA